MNEEQMRSYITNLPIGAQPIIPSIEEEVIPGVVDPNNLPDAVVTGTNLVEFEGEVDPVLRSSVALSLLAAQRVASNDGVIANADQWLERHNTVLRNLNWTFEGGGTVEQEFEKTGVEVHKAIIPFITAALGGVAASLIVTALAQLQTINEDSPWITLFDRESRRFQVSEYHFTRASASADKVVMKMAAARFDATFGRTQVLFFKITKQRARFEMASSDMAAESALLRMTNDTLKAKLALLTNDYIRELNISA